MGYALRRRVVEVVKTFTAVAMITLTVDRTLFRNAQDAYEWVRDHHGIGRLVQNLKRKGWIKSGRYIWFLEFQKGGWPHWHVLVEAKYVPAGLVYELWGKLRPLGIERVEGRPPFGKVDVSAGKFESGEHAANYATKYVIKEPRDGWPEWVWEFEGRVARYGVSRGFWGEGKGRLVCSAADEGVIPHAPECFCEECREGKEEATGKRKREGRTIRERVKGCGFGTALVRLRTAYNAVGEAVRVEREYVAVTTLSFQKLCEAYSLDPWEGRARLGRYQLRKIKEEFVGHGLEMEEFDRGLAVYVPF